MEIIDEFKRDIEKEVEKDILDELRQKIDEFGRAMDKTGEGYILIDIGLNQYDLEKSFIEKNIEELEDLIVKFNILMTQAIIIAKRYRSAIYKEIALKALDVSAVLAKIHIFALATGEVI